MNNSSELQEYKNIIRLEIELNNYCNLKCPLCIRNIETDINLELNNKKLDLDSLIEKLDKFPNLKYVTIAGPTSEPTLNKNLFEILEYLDNRSIETSLFINGNTHDDYYYKKLGFFCRLKKVKIYFTICGSTQELHSKYRINSDLSTIIKRANILNKIIKKKFILTWIIFEYNQKDYIQNKNKFNHFQMEIFYTIPMAEYYNLPKNGINLPIDQRRIYYSLDKEFNKKSTCKSIKNNFGYMDNDLNLWPCSIAKLNNFTFDDIQDELRPECFECFENNLKKLSDNKIHTISESEDNISEENLWL